MTSSLPQCTNCGKPVAQFEKGGSWRHYHSLFVTCTQDRGVATPQTQVGAK